MGMGGQRNAPAASPPENIRGVGLDGREHLAPSGNRFLDRSARSESLYQLGYPGLLYE